MQKLYELKAVTPSDYPELKEMWCEIFGDKREVVDNFFEKTVRPDRIVAVFYRNKPVSCLYLLDSTVTIDGESFSAFYIYGVCTHISHRGKGLMKMCLDEAYKRAVDNKTDYLYLVPASAELFDMYGAMGYKTGFYYDEKVVKKYDCSSVYQINALLYADYVNYRKTCTVPSATVSENTFNSFYKPVGDEIKVISIAGEGYAVFENDNGNCVVHEFFGNKSLILGCVFDYCGLDTLTVKQPVFCGGRPYAMYKITGDSPEISNGFFGIPYGG